MRENKWIPTGNITHTGAWTKRFLVKETSLFSCMVYQRKSVNAKKHMERTRHPQRTLDCLKNNSSIALTRLARAFRFVLRGRNATSFGSKFATRKATSLVFLPMHASSLNNLERTR